ncbi:TonB-dependent receptor [Pseudoflavitalea sp. G-6-1-2]|uniref:TonB-dependent receptor n=1 Tax=Pseudoflavitalea sp. G-6-1-2 TaxID=2728841 RepID=UPI00146B46B1|nr:TonB-dependent receptor [Pseudoflavitalea sp. G-6-1-2]NML20263.1 TonB-dependent receptor [Pseudoflavitalea sp. G-6-1-2]
MRFQTICSIFLLLFCQSLSAQTLIKGTITGSKNLPLNGASITLTGTYYGATSGNGGQFSFSSPDTGHFELTVTLIGYKKSVREVRLTGEPLNIDIILKEEISEMQAVTVSAGSFEAGNQKRNTVLNSLDIVTMAGKPADVVAALQTLPGAQQVGETEGLFVRGGTGAETKVFIDGMLVTNPFYSSVPDISQRGRFSPLLFKGTHFSSGGYSAQYGQAMSSALTLQTHDLPSRSETNMIISSPQLSFTRQQLAKNEKSSIGFSINYNNLTPYFAAVPQKPFYTKAPEIINGEFFGRWKTTKGMFKYYGYATHNTIAFHKPSLEDEKAFDYFSLKGENIFTILTYSGKINDSWKINYGGGFSYNKDRIDIRTASPDSSFSSFYPRLTNYTTQARLVFTRTLGGLSKLHFGTESQLIIDKIHAEDSIPYVRRQDNFIAAFAESDIYITGRFLAKPGARVEYSSLLGKANISPRLSFAWKLNNAGQISLAYGIYYQKPETTYLLRKPLLDYSRASHYIFNYERIAKGRTIRAELFYKQYHNLVRFPANNPMQLTNDGAGYAKGFELFWRDKKLFKGFDYWISYSWLDTKRQFLDYPSKVQPTFAANHTANVVAKQFVESITTSFSITYTYATGRPYYDPNLSEKSFLSSRTMDYHSLSCMVNYLTVIGKANTVFMVNVSNVLGNSQVYGYHFASKPSAGGMYRGEPITPMAKRFIFIGAFISIGNDRRKEILDL